MMNLRLSVRSVITLMCCVFGAVSFASAQVHVIQTQDHTIQNPGIGGGDEFGYAVSVDNEQLIVGAPITGLSAFNGFVRLYDFDTQNNVWIESTNQLPDQSNNNIKWGWYGAAVSILGDTVVVGAPKRDPNSTGFFWDGAAFIYRWNGTSWVTIQKAGIQLEQLGTSVSQIANFIAIGAPLHTNTSGDVSGGVYMYERANVGDDWINEPIVDGTATNEEFGYSVALFTDQASDDWLVVGAPGANKAYVYKRGPSDWGTAFVLLPDPLTADDVVAFGNSVTMTETATDTWIIVGDPEFGTDDLTLPPKTSPFLMR